MLQVYDIDASVVERLRDIRTGSIFPNILGAGVMCGDKEAWKEMTLDYFKTIHEYHSRGLFVGKEQNIYNAMLIRNLIKHPFRVIRAVQEPNMDIWFSFLAILSGSLPCRVNDMFESRPTLVPRPTESSQDSISLDAILEAFVFVPMTDSPGFDLYRAQIPLGQMMLRAFLDPTVVAFTTLGHFKHTISSLVFLSDSPQ